MNDTVTFPVAPATSDAGVTLDAENEPAVIVTPAGVALSITTSELSVVWIVNVPVVPETCGFVMFGKVQDTVAPPVVVDPLPFRVSTTVCPAGANENPPALKPEQFTGACNVETLNPLGNVTLIFPLFATLVAVVNPTVTVDAAPATSDAGETVAEVSDPANANCVAPKSPERAMVAPVTTVATRCTIPSRFRVSTIRVQVNKSIFGTMISHSTIPPRFVIHKIRQKQEIFR